MRPAEARRKAAAHLAGSTRPRSTAATSAGRGGSRTSPPTCATACAMLAHSRTFTLWPCSRWRSASGPHGDLHAGHSLLLQTLRVNDRSGMYNSTATRRPTPLGADPEPPAAAVCRLPPRPLGSSKRFDLSQEAKPSPSRAVASGEFFEVWLSSDPGKDVHHRNDRRGGRHSTVAVIRHAFWQRQFSGAADAVRPTISLNKVPFTIVGVTPPEFMGPQIGRGCRYRGPVRTADVLDHSVGQRLDGRSMWWLTSPRLKPGQRPTGHGRAPCRPPRSATRRRPTTARRALEGIPSRRTDVVHRVTGSVVSCAVSCSSPGDDHDSRLAGMLIACANIANLMLAGPAPAARNDHAPALGASRARLAAVGSRRASCSRRWAHYRASGSRGGAARCWSRSSPLRATR